VFPSAPHEFDWKKIRRGNRFQPGEWLAERLIFLVSLSAILMVFLIFLFVAREAFPILIGTATSASNQKVIPASEMDKLSAEQLRVYLGMKPDDFKKQDRETLKLLMEVREEAAKETPDDRDSGINTVGWRYLLRPFQWGGLSKPEYIWAPTSRIPKFNLIPLFVGSLKTTFVALLFAVPIALGAALYVSQLAPPRLREWLKPSIEMLSGIPSVVLGSFALLVAAPFLEHLLNLPTMLNAFVAGLALGLTCVPVIFSIAEDAISSVPQSFTQAALALGASRWRAAWDVVTPAALPGIFAAVVLGFGRAIGETMVVLIASGNAAQLSGSIFDSARTVTATIAAELAEAVFGSPHYRVLFLLGTLLFGITFVSNLAGQMIVGSLKGRLEGKR
jgi:phosphate transport system permease protein